MEDRKGTGGSLTRVTPRAAAKKSPKRDRPIVALVYSTTPDRLPAPTRRSEATKCNNPPTLHMRDGGALETAKQIISCIPVSGMTDVCSRHTCRSRSRSTSRKYGFVSAILSGRTMIPCSIERRVGPRRGSFSPLPEALLLYDMPGKERVYG